MYFDNHMHTKHFSEDGRMTIEEALAKREAFGGCITLTEHYDYDYPPPYTFQFDPKEYFEMFSPFRKEGELHLGIEVGLQPCCVAKNERLVASYPFDQVIGSTHLVGSIDVADPKYYKGKDRLFAQRLYLETMLSNITAFHDYDVMGHIDYIARYSPYPQKELRYEEHSERIDAILKILIKEDKALEINTRLLDVPEHYRALERIAQRYRELGGVCVTLGSDAHEAAHIFHNFSLGEQMICDCGLRQVYFIGRKRHFVIA